VKRILARPEAMLALAIIVLAIGFGLVAPQFFSFAHLFGIARSTIVIGLMALGLLLVLIAGGIDVSVSATAVVSMYVTVVTLGALDYDGPFLVAVLLATSIGALLGLVNALLVSLFRLPSLIVTLGTLTLYRGALLAFVGTNRIRDLPASMPEFARAQVFAVESASGRTASLHLGVVVFLGVAAALAWALRSTTWGRGVYAVGDNQEAAERFGVSVVLIRATTFALAGALAGMAGLMSGALNRAADPFTIVGTELDVLAAVVLGGASILGGRGTVVGTLLGVLLVTLVGSSLILVGIPSAWRQAFVGLFLLLGVGLPAWRQRRAERARGVVVGAT
jgi:simple sugar transport system permease protein